MVNGIHVGGSHLKRTLLISLLMLVGCGLDAPFDPGAGQPLPGLPGLPGPEGPEGPAGPTGPVGPAVAIPVTFAVCSDSVAFVKELGDSAGSASCASLCGSGAVVAQAFGPCEVAVNSDTCSAVATQTFGGFLVGLCCVCQLSD